MEKAFHIPIQQHNLPKGGKGIHLGLRTNICGRRGGSKPRKNVWTMPLDPGSIRELPIYNKSEIKPLVRLPCFSLDFNHESNNVLLSSCEYGYQCEYALLIYRIYLICLQSALDHFLR